MNVMVIAGLIFLILALIIDTKKDIIFKFIGSARLIERSCLLCLFLSVLSFLASPAWHEVIYASKTGDMKVRQLPVVMPEMVVTSDAVPQGETGFCIVYVGELNSSNRYGVIARNDQKLKPFDRVEVSRIDLPQVMSSLGTDYIHPLVVSRITHRAGERQD